MIATVSSPARAPSATPLELVRLTSLMQRTSGRPEVVIGLMDGPVAMTHPELVSEHIREAPGKSAGMCSLASSSACLHGTFVAGILNARRGSPAPAICPDCTLLVRPIFAEPLKANELLPSATPPELAAAIVECIDAGARVLNLSLALAQPSSAGQRELEEALDYAFRRGVLVVAAAGNQGAVGSSAITRHPWVISVVGYDLQGRPTGHSNLGSSIGRRGLGAPGDRVTSLGAEGKPLTISGTSVAAPFVTGALALLWSEFPKATAAELKLAITEGSGTRRITIVPPLLDAWSGFLTLSRSHNR